MIETNEIIAALLNRTIVILLPTVQTKTSEPTEPPSAAEKDLASARALIERLHNELRKAQDELATMQVKYVRVCEAIPPSYIQQMHAGDDEKEEEKSDAMDKAIAFEDAPAAVSAVSGVATKGKCQTCQWCPTGVCNRQDSPHIHHHVGAGWKCDKYLFTTEPRTAFSGTEGPELKYRQKLQRAKCDVCGHEVYVSSVGRLWAHDVKGHTYRGDGLGRADKSQPCPGKPVSV